MLKNIFKQIFIYTIGICSIFIFKCFSIFFNLKLVRINEKRIGHLSFDVEYILRNKQDDEIILLSYFDQAICNTYLHKLIKRKLIYSQAFNILHHSRKVFKDYEKFQFDLNWKHGVSRNLPDHPPVLKPMTSENIEGVNFIKNIGLDPNKLVALIVRDSSFLPELDHHQYRDCDIKNYYPLIHFLLSRGFSVIRMGKKMHSKVNIAHPHFYDYSFSSEKSDFLDTWIMMNAHEVISTGTGLENLTDISNKSYIGINFTPWLHYNSWNNLFWWAPKILFYANSNKPVPLSEQIESGSINFQLAQQYKDAGYIFRETSSEANIGIVEEILYRRNGIYQDKFIEERKIIQNKFINSEIFFTMHESNRNFNLSSEFIKNNLDWLLD